MTYLKNLRCSGYREEQEIRRVRIYERIKQAGIIILDAIKGVIYGIE
ncbi:MAG: hypothetical protein ACK4NF_05350 [Planctomycetota bacterium]